MLCCPIYKGEISQKLGAKVGVHSHCLKSDGCFPGTVNLPPPALRPPSIYSIWRESVCQAPTPTFQEEPGRFIVPCVWKVIIIPLRPNGARGSGGCDQSPAGDGNCLWQGVYTFCRCLSIASLWGCPLSQKYITMKIFLLGVSYITL